MSEESRPLNLHLSPERQEEIDRQESLLVEESWKNLFSTLQSAVLLQGVGVQDLTLSGPLVTKAGAHDALLTIRPYHCFDDEPEMLILDIHKGEDGEGQWLGLCTADAAWEEGKPNIIRFDEDLMDIDGKPIEIKDVLGCAINIVSVATNAAFEDGLNINGATYYIPYPRDPSRPELIH